MDSAPPWFHPRRTSRDVDVLIVGAGHTGLAMSALLREAGREHLVLERRDRLGGGWQDRWDEFRLVTPNWTASFPGWAYDGSDLDGFMTRDDIAGPTRRSSTRGATRGNDRGVTEIPGLSFLGLLWQHSQASASLVGPELDAPHVVEQSLTLRS